MATAASPIRRRRFCRRSVHRGQAVDHGRRVRALPRAGGRTSTRMAIRTSSASVTEPFVPARDSTAPAVEHDNTGATDCELSPGGARNIGSWRTSMTAGGRRWCSPPSALAKAAPGARGLRSSGQGQVGLPAVVETGIRYRRGATPVPPEVLYAGRDLQLWSRSRCPPDAAARRSLLTRAETPQQRLYQLHGCGRGRTLCRLPER